MNPKDKMAAIIAAPDNEELRYAMANGYGQYQFPDKDKRSVAWRNRAMAGREPGAKPMPEAAPTFLNPIQSGPDQASFLRSEKDTAPHYLTDKRGMFAPAMRNGYNAPDPSLLFNPFDFGGYSTQHVSPAMPEALGGHGAKVMKDIVDGKPLTQEEINHGAQGAANFMLTGGLTLNAGKRPQAGVASMFGGTASKTADMGMHNRANLMDSAGTPREQIWNETGWFKGVDQKWRHEIDDSGATFDPTRQRPFEHQKLFDAYPDAKDSYQSMVPGDGGSQRAIGTGRSFINIGADDANPRSVGGHEFQHHVQDAEGFARGGNLGSGQLAQSEWTPEIHAANDRINSAVARANDESLPMSLREQNEKMAKEFGQSLDFMSQAEHYRRLAGETEARTVQKRMDLTADERRARPPWLDYDVPESQQIVRFGSDGPQMSSSGAQPPKVFESPGHPLVNTTDQWTNTTLRRGLQQAIDAEAEYMAIPSGKTVLGYNPGDTHGMETFYNQIVPKNLGNILSKLDKAGGGKQFVQQLETPSGMKGDGFSVFQITPAMREQARKGLPLFMNPVTGAIVPLTGNAFDDR